MKTDLITLILAEDDDGHASLVETNLRRAGFANKLVRVKEGGEVLALLEARGTENSPIPAEGSLMLLLDNKMPGMDGIELLERMKADPDYASVPVIMLTTSDDPREINRCYELGCNVYISKPVEYTAFIEAIRRLGLLLQVVRVPNTKAA